MAQQLAEVMTKEPVVLDASEMASDAATQMRDRDVGDVLIRRDGELCGIVTDRDLVVRCLAEGKDPRYCSLGELCSEDLATLEADASIDEAIALMRQRAIRRLPVVRDGKPVGIVSLGDLAESRDPESALSDISAASPNH